MKYLKPHKLKPLKKDILVVSKVILDTLNTKKEIKITYLIRDIRRELKIDERSIIFAINFLYIFDKIEYIVNKDLIRIKNEI